MNKHFLLSAVLCATLLAGGCSTVGNMMASAPVKTQDGVFVDSKGMTLYTFDRDTAGKSACNGQCATNWPPLFASANDKAGGDWTIITRDDGKKQWAYKGKPVYTWVKDTKPGDKTGDGVNNVWHLARP